MERLPLTCNRAVAAQRSAVASARTVNASATNGMSASLPSLCMQHYHLCCFPVQGKPVNYSTIEYQIDDGILTVTLNRPDKMNAFTVEMCAELEDAFRNASSDDRVRAVVVAGKGRAFCAGMDLSVSGNVFGLNHSLTPTVADVRENFDEPAFVNGVRDTGGRVVLSIFDCNKPVIAALHGAAVGIGVTMTLPMDYRIAATDARLGFVFAKIGIVPEACSSWFLPRLVGMPKALEWTYSGAIIDAEEAQRAGLVQSVVAPEDVLAEAHRVAHRFTDGRSSVGIALTRKMMYRNSALPHPADAHLIDSLAVFYASQKDGKEGVEAFLQKRPPNFTARVSTDMPPLQPWPAYRPRPLDSQD
jgi:enoyl-CoA hydratase/carnithine racemase